ncbi:MAG: nicotinate-nucleotide adenylyltransferase [candidate division Zixibacteria bacterium]|nr:nicotinate-nucleotide adenylyltransferase [candidate division Zixibacteria bacterium]
MSKLGILGGTFDPPHIGHLILAQAALENLKLDKIIFIPAANQPQKQLQQVSSVAIRLKMLKLALGNEEQFEISEIEISRDGLSYTCDTVDELKDMYPKAALYLIIGGDNISEIETWKKPEDIFTKANVAAALRPEFKSIGTYMNKIKIIDMPQVDISSTLIRKNVKDGKSIKYLVPERVENYISANGLYR